MTDRTINPPGSPADRARRGHPVTAGVRQPLTQADIRRVVGSAVV